MFGEEVAKMAGNTFAGDAVDQEGSSSFPSQIPKMSIAAPHRAPAVRVREIAALLLLVVLGDLTLYRGAGYAGLAVLAIAGPVFLLLGSPQPKLRASFWLLS